MFLLALTNPALLRANARHTDVLNRWAQVMEIEDLDAEFDEENWDDVANRDANSGGPGGPPGPLGLTIA